MVALPPVSAEISGLAVPNSAVRLSFGKNSALATPMRALAASSLLDLTEIGTPLE